MKTAKEIAGIKPEYMPTTHAIDRARARFGIDEEVVREWINGLMGTAKFIGRNDGGKSLYKSGDVRLVVNDSTRTIITVHHDVSTDFLRPALERELRKLKRLYTRNIRALELKYAEAMRELADMAVNRAKARNPETRALIGERMTEKQSEIDSRINEIERMNDEYSSKKRAIELIAE